jgi:hypothetical protein
MRAMVTLTTEESKRLIARSIARMESIRVALKEGYIGFSICTSCGYIIQEILGKRSLDISSYCCGYIASGGSSSVSDDSRSKLLLLDHGQERWLNFPEENFLKYMKRMGEKDIIIKSGTILDKNGYAGCLVGSRGGGEYGDYLPQILSLGIQLIVPMTLNKYAPIDLHEIMPEMGIERFPPGRVHGHACGMMPMPGRVVTEIDAFRDLYGVRAMPVAMGGVGSGIGCVTLILIGDSDAVESAWTGTNEIKGEPSLENYS